MKITTRVILEKWVTEPPGVFLVILMFLEGLGLTSSTQTHTPPPDRDFKRELTRCLFLLDRRPYATSLVDHLSSPTLLGAARKKGTARLVASVPHTASLCDSIDEKSCLICGCRNPQSNPDVRASALRHPLLVLMSPATNHPHRQGFSSPWLTPLFLPGPPSENKRHSSHQCRQNETHW